MLKTVMLLQIFVENVIHCILEDSLKNNIDLKSSVTLSLLSLLVNLIQIWIYFENGHYVYNTVHLF